MQYQFLKPSRNLQPFIKNYWILEDDNVSETPCKQRIFPNGFAEMVFYYGDKYVNIYSNGKSEFVPFLQITGQKKDFYDVKPTGKIGLIAITFKPDAIKLFLNIPASEIENTFISFKDIYGSKINELECMLQTSTNNLQRIRLIEDFLIKQINESNIYDYNRINCSVNLINRNKGVISVKNLADSACLSMRQFNRTFTEYIGLNPKQFTKVIRFQNAIYQHQLNRDKSYTDLAYQCGYYDQAHFTNEFKLFTGYSPKDFFNQGEIYSDYFS
jgi:AraC-like DNA-binding protein/glutaredoxin-related protein